MTDGDVFGGRYDEKVEVQLRRYREARLAGLTRIEARLFAESDADIGELRKLVRARCDVELIRRIIL